jgi:hypothetical protein
MLSPADFATVDGILRSEELRRAEAGGFPCGPAAAGEQVSLITQRRVGVDQSEVVTCQEADVALRRLVRLIAAY